MTIQISETEFCKLQVSYQAEPSKVQAKRQEALKKFKSVKIPGFRKGKAPPFALEATLKKQLDEEVKREMLSEAYEDIIFESKIRSIGYPEVSRMDLNGDTFSCEMTLLKKPEIALGQYKDFQLPKPHAEHTPEEMVERMLQELRIQYGEAAPYGEKDFVKMGDKVTLDAHFSENEAARTDLTQEGILYRVGDKMLPGFDDGICGMSAGEERTFNVNLPDGKSGSVRVNLHMGMRTIPAPLDEALAQKVGFESYDKLREAAKSIADLKLQEYQNQVLSQQIIQRLVTSHDFQVPNFLVLMEAQQLAMQSQLKWAELDTNQKETFLVRGKDNVKLALILDQIKETEPEACFSEAELLQIIKQRVSATGQDPEKFLVESQRDGRLLGVLAALRNEAVLSFLLSKCQIVD